VIRITVGRMMPDIHIVFDCGDPDRLARFWMVALPGYDFPHGPPDGFTTWQEWADANDIPEQQRNAGRTLVDKHGHRPDIFFLAFQRGNATNQEPVSGSRRTRQPRRERIWAAPILGAPPRACLLRTRGYRRLGGWPGLSWAVDQQHGASATVPRPERFTVPSS
jgi:hypothetical protein